MFGFVYIVIGVLLSVVLLDGEGERQGWRVRSDWREEADDGDVVNALINSE